MTPKMIRQVRRGVQLLALLLFLYFFIFSSFLNPQGDLANLFYRLDPLVAATAMLAGRVFISGLALAGITLLLTLVFGRVWCGWICPMGTTLDLLAFRRKPRNNRIQSPPESLRVVKYLLLVFLIAAAVFANQTFLFLDPVTIMTRTLTGAVWPALAAGTAAIEAFLYQFDFLWNPLDFMHRTVIYPLFKDSQPVYDAVIPIALFFGVLIFLNGWAERFWCRYLCPLGGLLGWVARFALLQRKTGAGCTGCAVCTRRCPTGTIDPARNFASDPAECTVCFDCIDTCPKGESSFKWILPWQKKNLANNQKLEKPVYDPRRREVIGALSAAVVWTALAGVEPVRKRQPAQMIRPPGTNGTNFESLCIRCNECVRICPTHGLQPSFLEGGWQNGLTPRLEPRLGYCNYNCTACGEICPTGAIPRLDLATKQLTPIGLARIDRNRCLPWAYGVECIVCEEACPIGDKAIKLEVFETINERGEAIALQRPYVIQNLCIGCGMCEFQCPMGGDAAVRVYAYTEAGGFFGAG